MNTELIRGANRTLSRYGLDGDSETGEGGMVALHDTRKSQLVIEDEKGETLQRFPITPDLMMKVADFAHGIASRRMNPRQLAARLSQYDRRRE